MDSVDNWMSIALALKMLQIKNERNLSSKTRPPYANQNNYMDLFYNHI